jgi:excisionase family DNA binding protein
MVAANLPDRLRRLEPVHAPRADRADIAKLSTALHAQLERAAAPTCRLVGPGGQTLDLPAAVFHVLVRVVEILDRGDAITVVPVGKEMTTQQAADLLNVSRQYLVRLLDDGRIPYTRTGKHRRLRIEDVLAFKEQRDRERDAQLDAIAAMTQEMGGYPELE